MSPVVVGSRRRLTTHRTLHIPLSVCDNVIPPSFIQLVVGYTHLPATDVLERALRTVIEERAPALAGRLVCDAASGCWTVADGGYVEWVEATYTGQSVHDVFGSGQHEAQPLGLVPTHPPHSSNTTTIEGPLFSVQLTRLLDDGGIVLGVSVHHILMDVQGLCTVLGAWAAGVRGKDPLPRLVGGGDQAESGMIRTLLLCGTADKTAAVESEASSIFTQGPPLTGGPPPSFSLPRMQLIQLVLPSAAIDRFRGDADFLSSNSIISALLWSAVCRARGISDDVETSLAFVVDGRRRISPPLPPEYLGNAAFYGMAHGTGVGSRCVEELARLVHYAVAAATQSASLRATLRWIEAQPRKDTLHNPFVTAFLGKNVAISNWSSLPLADIDFGTGGPFAWDLPRSPLAMDGIAIILPASPAVAAWRGALTVYLGLMCDHADQFLRDERVREFVVEG